MTKRHEFMVTFSTAERMRVLADTPEAALEVARAVNIDGNGPDRGHVMGVEYAGDVWEAEQPSA